MLVLGHPGRESYSLFTQHGGRWLPPDSRGLGPHSALETPNDTAIPLIPIDSPFDQAYPPDLTVSL